MNWENALDNADGSIVTSGKAGKFVAPAPYPYTALRTPLGLVESDTKDNVFTLFFTAFDSSRDPAMIGSYASLYI